VGVGDRLDAMTGRDSPDRVLVTIQVIAAALFVVAATVMPWATYENVMKDATTTFQSGDFGPVLVAIGIATVVLALVSLVRPIRILAWLQLGLGGVALVVSVVIALDKISAANHVVREGASRTSYQYGAPTAIIASGAVVVTAIITLTRNPDRRNENGRRD
jgi:hypothetical protein